MTNVKAEPNRDPAAAMGKPFIPYAYPHNVTSVVWPTLGGNDTTTVETQLLSKAAALRL